MPLVPHYRRGVYILGVGLIVAGLIVLVYSLWIPRYIVGFRVIDDRSLLKSVRDSSAFLRDLLIGEDTIPTSNGFIIRYKVDKSILYMNYTCIFLRLNGSSTMLIQHTIIPTMRK